MGWLLGSRSADHSKLDTSQPLLLVLLFSSLLDRVSAEKCLDLDESHFRVIWVGQVSLEATGPVPCSKPVNVRAMLHGSGPHPATCATV